MKNPQFKSPNPDNIWRNVYWFARTLISTDKAGGFGSKSSKVVNLASAVRTVLDSPNITLDEEKLFNLLQTTLKETLSNVSRVGTKAHLQNVNLADELNSRIKNIDGFRVLQFTLEQILIPTNSLLDNVPNDDRAYADVIVKAYLKNEGENALSSVINLWDDLGIEGSLTAERIQVVSAFRILREYLSQKSDSFNNEDSDYILTAFIQEIERRLGQKRKSRAGGSLEDVTSVILKHFSIPTTHKPEHFQADIEVDKWVQASDGWLIGISCKRTLRERWKQVSSADYGVMSRYKIKEVWHVITYSNDLSEDKLVTLGAGRQFFYLPDDSPAYITYSEHSGMSRYVRPMSQFISDLKRETNK